jgi:hypothetical protein
MAISVDDLEFIRITASDLNFLKDAARTTATEDELRRLSVTLRNLLFHEHIRKAWKLLGLRPKSPTISAPRLRTDFVAPEGFAAAGGGQLPGAAISQVSFSNHFMSMDEMIAVAKTVTLGDMSHSFPLSDYLASCSIFTKGQRVTRLQVILYVAHKKGGAHWDTRRKSDEASYKALDGVGDLRIGGSYDADRNIIEKAKHPIFFEILSIGQQLFKSPDIHRLIAEANRVLDDRSE